MSIRKNTDIVYWLEKALAIAFKLFRLLRKPLSFS